MLVEEVGAEQFHVAKLCSGEFCLAYLVDALMDGAAHASGNVDVDAALIDLLLCLGSCLLVGGRQLADVLYGDVKGFA